MYLSIDPGLKGTGWASWDGKFNLTGNGVITPNNSLSIPEKMMQIALELNYQVYSKRIKQVYIETPQKFQGTGGDMVANRGDLVKLAVLTGYLVGYLRLTFSLIYVVNWKGQLPKEVVIKRIKKILPKVNAKSHDWDAIGLGLYVAGRF